MAHLQRRGIISVIISPNPALDFFHGSVVSAPFLLPGSGPSLVGGPPQSMSKTVGVCADGSNACLSLSLARAGCLKGYSVCPLSASVQGWISCIEAPFALVRRMPDTVPGQRAEHKGHRLRRQRPRGGGAGWGGRAGRGGRCSMTHPVVLVMALFRFGTTSEGSPFPSNTCSCRGNGQRRAELTHSGNRSVAASGAAGRRGCT